MFDFEVRMRKTMTDFMGPAIERMTHVSESMTEVAKASENMQQRLADLEDAVYNQGRGDIFQELREQIQAAAVQRKVENEELRDRMFNVEKLSENQTFIVEQLSKQFDTAVIRERLKTSLAYCDRAEAEGPRPPLVHVRDL